MAGAPLFSADKCALVVIDVQDYFLAKLPLDWRKPLVERIAWLMQVASILEIPVIATAEDISNDGPLVPDLEKQLRAGTSVHDKKSSASAANPIFSKPFARRAAANACWWGWKPMSALPIRPWD